MKIKTIDIQAKEWFDKVNGNSYHSAVVTLNYGLKDAKTVKVPFTYGYGEHYMESAREAIKNTGTIKDIAEGEMLWSYCDRKKIILRANIQRNCLKRDVIAFGL